MYLSGLWTRGNELNFHVIYISIVVAAGGLRSLDGNVCARTGVLVQRNFVVGVSGGAGSDSGDWHESVDVCRVCHHTDYKIEGIASGVVAGIKSELQGVHRQCVHIDFRQDGNLGVIRVCSNGGIEPHRVGARDGIGSAIVNNRITRV